MVGDLTASNPLNLRLEGRDGLDFVWLAAVVLEVYTYSYLDDHYNYCISSLTL